MIVCVLCARGTRGRAFLDLARFVSVVQFILLMICDVKKFEKTTDESLLKKTLTPDQFLEYLEWKVQQHIPNCKAKNYLLQRVTAATETNSKMAPVVCTYLLVKYRIVDRHRCLSQVRAEDHLSFEMIW